MLKEVSLTKEQKQYINSYQYNLAILAFPVMLSGIWMRSQLDADGHYIFPQIFRHHLVNIGDPIMVAPLISKLDFIRDMGPVKKTLCTAFGAAAAGISFEACQAFWPGRSFDVGDSLTYIAGASIYLGLMLREIYSLANSNKPHTPPEHRPG